MAVKLSKLKNKKIRAVVPVMVDGSREEINVFNPTPEQRVYFNDFLSKKVDKLSEDGTKIEITPEEILRLFYTELTDLVIEEEEILDIIASPSSELLQVARYINQIVHEITMEVLINKESELNRIREIKQQGQLVETTKRVLSELGIEEEDLKKIGLDIEESVIKE